MFIANDLISSSVPTLNLTDSAAKVMRLMNEYHLAQLPLADGMHYIGLVEESVIMDWEDPERLMLELDSNCARPAIHLDAPIFEVLRIASINNLSVIPVLDHQENYLGSIAVDSLMKVYSRFFDISETGALVSVLIHSKDFVLSELARLAESEGIRILGVHMLKSDEDESIEVVLKTNTASLSSFIGLLERYEYVINYKQNEVESKDILERNLGLLMNYINM